MPEIEYFETKTIKCGAASTNEPVAYTILLQNANGPCPLVALVNTLILSDQKIQQKDGSVLSLASFTEGKEIVSVNGLLEQLGELLIQKQSYDDEASSKTADNALGLLPKLVSGLNINVRFNGTFEETAEMSLFRIYDVDIVHGWICDPDDPEYAMISKVDSYDEAQSVILRNSEGQPLGSDDEDTEELGAKASAVKHFMEANATQLTSYGLGQLRALLSPDSPSVFFRNDHFATIIVRNNCLYTLVADQGYKDQPGVVWHSLTGASGNEDNFYDGFFNSPSNVEEQEAEDPRFQPDKAKDDQQDYLLARELQMAEDSEMAQRLASENNRGAGSAPRGNASRGSTRAGGSGATPKDKKKKCIIM